VLKNRHENAAESSLCGYKSAAGIKIHTLGCATNCSIHERLLIAIFHGAGIQTEDRFRLHGMPLIRFYVSVTQFLTDIKATPFGSIFTDNSVRFSIAQMPSVRQVFCFIHKETEKHGP